VNLNITSDRLSRTDSIVTLFCPCTRASATAKMMAKKTIWSTSFAAAASKKLCGTVCSSTPDKVVLRAANCAPASAEAAPRSTPMPGFVRFTATSPITSARVVTISK
jgi:hypothetical protein